MRLRSSRLLPIAVLVLVAAAGPSEASAVLDAGSRPEVLVRSIDGPRDLTVRIGRHTVRRVRIDNIDAPRAARSGQRAECGAALATSALRRLAPPGRRIFLFSYGIQQHGRTLVDAEYRIGHDGSDDWFSWKLAALGAARPGVATGLRTVAAPNTDRIDLSYQPFDSGYFADDPVNLARKRVGVWGACRGRFHLPAGRRPPKVRPARWTISATGRTTAIGALALAPSDTTPTRHTTFGDVARAFPDLELVRDYEGMCVGVAAAAATRFEGLPTWFDTTRRQRSCAASPVYSVTTLGRSATGTALRVGSPVSEITAAYPSAITRGALAELDGLDLDMTADPPVAPPTAWRTAGVVRHGQVTGLYARLPIPQPPGD